MTKNLLSYSNNAARTHQLDPKLVLSKRLTWELVADVNVEKRERGKERKGTVAQHRGQQASL